jgi:hypothetical protein
MTSLPQFPSTNSIPPACFYTFQGLAGWLNQNPSYKIPFSYTDAFRPYLIRPDLLKSSIYSSFATVYNPETVPLCSNVQTLSQNQAQKYGTQLALFQKVYAINSNAYVNYVVNRVGPVYYTFSTFNEKYEYNSAVQLVNKLYPFRAMAEASSLNWQVPFPINM